MTTAHPKLLLYKRDDCPFCRRVADKIAALGMDLPTRDVSDEGSARADLVALGGKSQVPCLVIDGRPMYESEAIINFLETLATRS